MNRRVVAEVLSPLFLLLAYLAISIWLSPSTTTLGLVVRIVSGTTGYLLTSLFIYYMRNQPARLLVIFAVAIPIFSGLYIWLLIANKLQPDEVLEIVAITSAIVSSLAYGNFIESMKIAKSGLDKLFEPFDKSGPPRRFVGTIAVSAMLAFGFLQLVKQIVKDISIESPDSITRVFILPLALVAVFELSRREIARHD